MKPVRALLIGGPCDGEWITATSYIHTMMVMPEPNFSGLVRGEGDPLKEMVALMPIRHNYHIESVEMFGYRLWVGLHRGDMIDPRESRSTLLLRAILQRDVAQAMGVK